MFHVGSYSALGSSVTPTLLKDTETVPGVSSYRLSVFLIRGQEARSVIPSSRQDEVSHQLLTVEISTSPTDPLSRISNSTDNQAFNQAVSATTESFVSSLVVNIAVAGGELLAWVLIRRQFKAIYEPRTYLPPKAKRAPQLTKNLVLVLWELINSDPKLVLGKNGVGKSSQNRSTELMGVPRRIRLYPLYPDDAQNFHPNLASDMGYPPSDRCRWDSGRG